ncbi:hypothetical protein [Curtobacterium sp. HSID17257]|uniref:hypothetical protein n=1 Tax=Curtobacterium sp. HSID17257 TaxID=2419510 RepID=UPI000F86ECC3|nr:hypothetical protein [Curtobacterium sp. HSID17257]
MRTWTAGVAVGLALRSWLWMAFVTTPATTLLGAAWLAAASSPPDVGSAALTVLLVSVPTGVVSLAGAVLAVPFTFVLGRVLVHGRAHRPTAIVAHAVLAGVLAALGMQVVVALWSGSWTPPPSWTLLVSVPAGLAAAIGTARFTAPIRVAALRSGAPADHRVVGDDDRTVVSVDEVRGRATSTPDE